MSPSPEQWAKRTRPGDERGTDLGLGEKDGAGTGRRGPRIRCPKCSWEPRRDSRWACLCHHEWNTFDTAGLCPSCGFQWEDTCCLSCLRWSPHREWYVSTDDDGDGDGDA